MEEKNNKLLNSKDVAKIFGVSTMTIRNWRLAGHLNYIKLGNVYRYSLEDIENIIKRMRKKSSETKE